MVEKDKEVQEWNEQQMPEVLSGCQEEAQKKRQGSRGKRGKERRVRYEVAQEVVADV